MSDQPAITIRAEMNCPECGHHLCDHEKTKVYPDDGPAGTYHYQYECPVDGVSRHD